MAKEFEISDAMRESIGKESPPWTSEVTTTSIRAFARGVGYTDPVYFDVDAAQKAGYKSLPAPPCYLGTPVFIPGRSSDTFSGPVDGQPRVDHGLPGLLDGGTETEYFDQVCAGDTLTVVSKVADLTVRQSGSLGKMLLVTNETTYTNQQTGKLVAKQTSQAIFY
ncbi:MAG: MaoC family dehydratase [bacterium]|nr:MaoC family dehydratase [bacterium]